MSELTLRDARELVGIGQSELDREAGLTQGTVHDIEAGRTQRPSHETVTRIIRALRRRGLAGIDAERLFPVPDGREVA